VIFLGRERNTKKMYETTTDKQQNMFALEILKPASSRELLTLQKNARDILYSEPYSAAAFDKFLTRENGLMIGLREAGELIAQVTLFGPILFEEANDKNLITHNDVLFHHAQPSELVIVLKSMMIRSAGRENEIARKLLPAALAQPMSRVVDHIFAQTSAEIAEDWLSFLHNGFGVVAAAVDSNGHQPRFILQKPALGFSLYPEASEENIDPVKDFTDIMRLTRQDALVGQCDLLLESKLALHARTEAAASWYDHPSQAANGD
jgi:hypothetical protein